MEKLKIELNILDNGMHLQQIFTGFYALEKMGLIRLKQQKAKINRGIYGKLPSYLQDSYKCHLFVKINQLRVFYDTHDSFEILEENLSNSDVYFKRSFKMSYVESLKNKEKIFPLGLNYAVYPSGASWYNFKRAFMDSEFILKKFLWDASIALNIEALLGIKQIKYLRANSSLSFPLLDSDPKVIFLARVWDPTGCPSQEKKDERNVMNQNRMEIIRSLRKELGSRFLGGIAEDSYSKKLCPDCLVDDNSLVRQHRYFQTLRNYPIAIATTGLHGSNGWKLAEYVALSKAIVAETLNYDVPGGFSAYQNYLPFTNPNECISSTMSLVDSKTSRRQMMINNFDYYMKYLKPEHLVLNTLLVSLKYL